MKNPMSLRAFPFDTDFIEIFIHQSEASTRDDYIFRPFDVRPDPDPNPKTNQPPPPRPTRPRSLRDAQSSLPTLFFSLLTCLRRVHCRTGPRGGGAKRALLLRHPAGRLRVGLHRLQQGVLLHCSTCLYPAPPIQCPPTCLHPSPPLSSPSHRAHTPPLHRLQHPGLLREHGRQPDGVHQCQSGCTSRASGRCAPRASTPPLHPPRAYTHLLHVLLPPHRRACRGWLHVLLPSPSMCFCP